MIAELHCHSRSSRLPYFPLFYDAVQSIDEILAECVSKNIEILAVTEHDSLDGYWKAKRIIEKKKLPIILVPGMEISSKGGHILAYGIEEEIPYGLTPRETIEQIHAQGGIALAAHPFIFFYSIGKHIFNLDFDGVEGINSLATLNANKKALAAAKKMDLPAIAGSDAHYKTGMGCARTIFTSTKIKNWQEVLKAIKNKEFTTEVTYQSWIKVFWENVSTNIMILLTA